MFSLLIYCLCKSQWWGTHTKFTVAALHSLASPPHSSCCSHTKPPVGLTHLIVSEALYLADAILCLWNALSPSTSSAKVFLGLFSPTQIFHEANPRVIPSSILLLLLALTSVLASKGPDSNRELLLEIGFPPCILTFASWLCGFSCPEVGLFLHSDSPASVLHLLPAVYSPHCIQWFFSWANVTVSLMKVPEWCSITLGKSILLTNS